MLVGRAAEVGTLERLLHRVESGRASVLVLRGDAGVGKTALLDAARRAATGFVVARATGVRSEMELSYAGLQQLSAGLPDALDRLPRGQADALRTALGRTTGPAADPFLVGLAVGGMLAAVASERPAICLVDDIQWLDRATVRVLAFVARRLESERVGLILASRPVSDDDRLQGLPELRVGRLSTADSRRLLTTALSGPLDPGVAERVIVEARGNPLALLELPRTVGPDSLAGGYGAGSGAPVQGRVEAAFAARVQELPLATRLLLVVAAAEPLGSPSVLWRAADFLGIEPDALAAAEDAGLVEVRAQVTFRHPLARSVVYDSATPTQLRRAHTALAHATDPEADPDRYAWHLAFGTRGPDEAIAAELERSAGRAQDRGGYYAASAFLERAMELSVDPGDRARRALAAAHLKELAGAPESVARLLAVAEAGPLDAESSARAERLRGRGAFVVSRATDAAEHLLRAARALEPFDPEASRETYLEALSAALFAARTPGVATPDDIARAALSAPRPSSAMRPSDLLLDGIATLVTSGSEAAAAPLRQALDAFAADDLPPEAQIRWMWLASRMSVLLWDDVAWGSLAGRASRFARSTGALTALTAALSSEMALLALSGDLDAAEVLADEADAVARSVGLHALPYGPAVIGAWRGLSSEVDALLGSSLASVAARGEGMGVALVHWARALLHNSRGAYEEALAEGQRSISFPPAMLYSHWGLVETIEAAARVDDTASGMLAFDRLRTSTRASGTDWAAGVEARCRALLSEEGEAEACFQEAVDRLARTSMTADLARAELLYGEWLRRQRRRAEARSHLLRASDLFVRMGAQSFAERARLELATTGVAAGRLVAAEPRELSAQERRVARLASQGLSNQEIANQLFISTSTVDYHLRKVFRKLAISSRSKLHLVLPSEGESDDTAS